MKSIARKVILCSILVNFGILISVGQELNTAKLDSLFMVLDKQNKAMGSLTISQNGKQVYNKTIGFSHFVNDKPVNSTLNTKYRVGSITKMFTSVMILQLIEENKLKMETPLADFFPDIPNSNLITIMDLLSHRSGIYDFTTDSTYFEWVYSPKSHEEILSFLYKKLPDFMPGSKAVYSNSNYVLLGYILELIDKKNYKEILQNRITTSAGLTNTYYGGVTNVTKNECYSFFYEDIWYQHLEADMSIPHGAGAIVSTSGDLVKFIEALFNEKLISKSSLEMMLTQKDGFGLGIFQFPFGERKAYGHSGSIDAFAANLAYFPDEKLAIAYTANGLVYPINDIMIGVLSICFNEKYKIPEFKTLKLDTKEMNKYTGLYTIQDAPLTLRIFIREDKLLAQASGQNPFPLTAVETDKFVFEQASIVIEFNLAKNELSLNQGGQIFLFTKKDE